MSIGFPTSPTINDTYIHTPTKIQYKWDGIKWVSVPKNLPSITGYLHKTGSTMSGQLLLTNPGSGTNNLQTKQYVDKIFAPKISQRQGDARISTIGNPRYVNYTGDTMTGTLNHHGDIILNPHPTYKDYSNSIIFSSNWLIRAHHIPGTVAQIAFTYALKPKFAIRLSSHDVWAFSYRNVSDISLKENIKEVTDAGNKLKGAKLYRFTSLFANDHKRNTKSIGVIAQKLEETLPEAVSEIEEESEFNSKNLKKYKEVDLGVVQACTFGALNEIITKLETT